MQLCLRRSTTLLATLVWVIISCAPAAAQATSSPPVNVLQLSASATMDVLQDVLSIRLSTTREGAEAQQVQAGVKSALETALAQARPQARAGMVDIRTGAFSLQPRFNREGRITGWVGSAELVIEGKDLVAVPALAGKLSTLNVSSVQFGLSREERIRVESEVQAQAVERFRARAAELSRGFGFSGFSVREVSVSGSEPGIAPRQRLMLAASASADSPVPVEAGRVAVSVTVSGSIQMR